MSHGKATFLRIVMILVALALIFVGLWGVGLQYHVSAAEKLGDYSDPSFWQDLRDQSWYPTALGIISVLLVLIGLWLWWLVIDRRRVSRLETKESADQGRVVVRLDDVASAASQELTRYDGVKSCNYRAEVDRGQKMVTLTLRCDPQADLDRITELCRQAAADIVAALPQEDVDTRCLIQLDRATVSS